MSECKHEASTYINPHDVACAGFKGASHQVYRCEHCGKYVYRPKPWENWALAPDSVQDEVAV